MPELAEGDLDDRDLACRLDLRSERDRWIEIVMVLEGTSKTKDLSVIEEAANLLLAA